MVSTRKKYRSEDLEFIQEGDDRKPEMQKDLKADRASKAEVNLVKDEPQTTSSETPTSQSSKQDARPPKGRSPRTPSKKPVTVKLTSSPEHPEVDDQPAKDSGKTRAPKTKSTVKAPNTSRKSKSASNRKSTAASPAEQLEMSETAPTKRKRVSHDTAPPEITVSPPSPTKRRKPNVKQAGDEQPSAIDIFLNEAINALQSRDSESGSEQPKDKHQPAANPAFVPPALHRETRIRQVASPRSELPPARLYQPGTGRELLADTDIDKRTESNTSSNSAIPEHEQVQAALTLVRAGWILQVFGVTLDAADLERKAVDEIDSWIDLVDMLQGSKDLD